MFVRHVTQQPPKKPISFHLSTRDRLNPSRVSIPEAPFSEKVNRFHQSEVVPPMNRRSVFPPSKFSPSIGRPKKVTRPRRSYRVGRSEARDWPSRPRDRTVSDLRSVIRLIKGHKFLVYDRCRRCETRPARSGFLTSRK